MTVSRGDGNNSGGKRLSNLNLIPEEDYQHAFFDIYFPLLFPVADSSCFSIKTKSSNGKTRNYVVAWISPEQRKAAFEREFGEIPKFEKTWDYKLLDDKTARLKFGTFSFWNSDFKWQSYLENVFKDLQSKPNVRNLIIDIRGNEGGIGEIRDRILSYITAKPVAGEHEAKICYRFLSVPDSLLKYLRRGIKLSSSRKRNRTTP